MLGRVHDLIDESEHDNWQIYLLIAALAVAFSEHANLYFITGLLHSLDGTVVLTYTVDELLISACQGSFIAILGNWMFSQGDSYFAFWTDSFDKKEVAVLVRVGLMTLLGVLGGLVVPDLIQIYAEFVVVQTFGVVILIGYGLVHSDIVNWKISNELPVIFAGVVLAGFPYVV